MAKGPQKKAEASLDNLRRVFTVPESSESTLARIERAISSNLAGFLNANVASGDMAPSLIEKVFSDVHIPEDPMFVSEQTDFLMENVVRQSVHTGSPAFIGHMTSALPYFMLPLAKITTALNQNTVKIETSKAFTPLESQVIGMLHHLIYKREDSFYARWLHDRDHALGVFCSGGTIANITSLWVARNRLLAPREGFRGVSHDGVFRGLRVHGFEDLAIVVSKRGHYSLRKAADVLGLGRANVIAVRTDARGKIDLAELRNTLTDLQRRRIGVCALVGVAGATETGSVDPLTAMADIAQEFRCNFHVDAAWGGPTLFSQRYGHLLAGIERADSVCIDAHKQLYVPMGAGMAVFRDETALSSVEHSAQYIIRKGSRDLGKHTLEGSRPGTALLVHSGLRILGRRGYEMIIDLGIGKAGQFAKMIQSTADFELMTEPETNLLTYRFVPPQVRAALADPDTSAADREALNEVLSELTANVQKDQRARGKTFVSRTRFDMPQYNYQLCTVFRVVLANPLTTRQILSEILDEQREIAALVLKRDGFGAKLDGILNTGRHTKAAGGKS